MKMLRGLRYNQIKYSFRERLGIMAVLIRVEEDGSISFGNAALKEKSKQDDFSHEGDIYKVKTWEEITKLERNGLFAYESLPGTNVEHMQVGADRVSFTVSGPQDAEITLGLEAGCEYDIQIDGKDAGSMKTNLGGKLTLSAELASKGKVQVLVTKA